MKKQVIELKKRGLILVLILILLTSISIPAYGDKLSNRLKSQKRQQARNRENYQNILDKIDNTEASIEKLDNQIETSMEKISAVNKKITVTKGNILKAQKAINSMNKNIGSEQELYNQRLGSIYMNGPTGYLEILLGSKNFVDFLERLELTKSIMKFDTKLINDLHSKKNNIEVKKAALVKQKNNLITLQNENKAQLAELKATKDKQNTLIKVLRAQEKKYRQAIAQYNNLINKTLKAIAEMRKRLKHSSGSKYSSDALVVYAANFLGVRYVWGGNTPSGFDCSGFTKYVFAHFGITLNRVSRDQAKQGSYVSKANLKPGDLVFFGSPVHHVGIYVGNNSFIEAPYTGSSVRISPLTRRDFVFGRRVR